MKSEMGKLRWEVKVKVKVGSEMGTEDGKYSEEVKVRCEVEK